MAIDKEKLSFIDSVRKNPFLRMFVAGQDVRDYIACQFALESNFGTSSLAKCRNNLCGMRIPNRRIYYGLPIEHDDGFASYDSTCNCIIDFISWILYNRPYKYDLISLSNFKIFLRNTGYCPEKDYIDKINFIYSQLKSYKNE